MIHSAEGLHVVQIAGDIGVIDIIVIKKGAVVRNSVVLAEVTVGEDVHIENEVVDKWAKLVHKKEIVSPAEQPGYIRRNDTL